MKDSVYIETLARQLITTPREQQGTGTDSSVYIRLTGTLASEIGAKLHGIAARMRVKENENG